MQRILLLDHQIILNRNNRIIYKIRNALNKKLDLLSTKIIYFKFFYCILYSNFQESRQYCFYELGPLRKGKM